MAGDLQGMRQRAGGVDERYERARERLRQTQQASLDRRAKKKAEEEKLRLQRELAAQEIAAQKARDERQFGYDTSLTAQRGLQQADSQAADFRYRSKLNDQQQRGTLKRDSLQQKFEAAQARQRAFDELNQDQRRFQNQLKENEQQFGFQTQRDATQQGFSLDKARLDQANTLQRDQLQFGYDTERLQQQHDNTLQRDVQENRFQTERDNRLNMFDVEQARMEQQFTEQNAYQAEAADISARWQEQVQIAKQAGFDFSPAQRKEMDAMEEAFRKNVLNGPYDEIVKKRALVEHQKKLAAIIPNQRVMSKQDDFESSRHFDEATGRFYRRVVGRGGQSEWEPEDFGNAASSGSSLQDAQAKQMEKQQERKQKAWMEREDRFNELVKDISLEENEDGTPKFKNPVAEAMQRFAPYEKHYRESFGLPALGPYAQEAKRMMEATSGATAQKTKRLNPWRQMLEQLPQGKPQAAGQAPAAAPAAAPAPAPAASNVRYGVGTVPQSLRGKKAPTTAKTLDTQIERATASNDQEAANALRTMKALTEKFNGPPPLDSPEMEEFTRAVEYLRDKGIPTEGEKVPKKPYIPKGVTRSTIP